MSTQCRRRSLELLFGGLCAASDQHCAGDLYELGLIQHSDAFVVEGHTRNDVLFVEHFF